METKARQNRAKMANEVRDKNGKVVRSSRGRPYTTAWLKLFQAAFGQGRFEEFCRKHSINPRILPKGPKAPHARAKAEKGPRSGRRASVEESEPNQKKEHECRRRGKAPEARIRKGGQPEGAFFRATFSNLGEFKGVVNAASRLVDEATIFFGEGGMRLRAMDPSRIAMVEFVVPPNSMESCDSNGDVPVGISLEALKSWLKTKKPKDKLVLECRAGDEQLHMTARGAIVVTGSLPLLDISHDEVDAPKTPINAMVRVLASAFKTAIREMEAVGDFARITAEDDMLRVSADGDRGCSEVCLTEEDGNVLDYNVKKGSSALYSLAYLAKTKSFPGEELEIEFSKDMPVKMTFHADLCPVVMYLAPRIEGEEE